jgi:hypothetical protein
MRGKMVVLKEGLVPGEVVVMWAGIFDVDV